MKKFLFLVLTVTLMLFVSFNAFAEDAFPEGRMPAPAETNPMQFHSDANSRGSIQTAINMPGSASADNRVANDDCPSCKQSLLRTESSGVVVDSSGNPVKVNEEGTDK